MQANNIDAADTIDHPMTNWVNPFLLTNRLGHDESIWKFVNDYFPAVITLALMLIYSVITESLQKQLLSLFEKIVSVGQLPQSGLKIIQGSCN